MPIIRYGTIPNTYRDIDQFEGTLSLDVGTATRALRA